MKQNETSSNFQENEDCNDNGYSKHQVGDSTETPLREDAFVLDDNTKIELIQKHFREIMLILGLDICDDSLKGTPKRVAKMFVNEIFSGLNPANRPKVTLFENKYKYDEIVLVRDITFFSSCEHHFLPFFGKAQIAYIPKNKVPGLSKINRLVQFYARRPQVQERLTIQLANELRTLLETEDVAVYLEAKHLCVAARGIEDVHSDTVTAKYFGKFNQEDYKKQFLSFIENR
jgi:GTP cyclohydrolase I